MSGSEYQINVAKFRNEDQFGKHHAYWFTVDLRDCYSEEDARTAFRALVGAFPYPAYRLDLSYTPIRSSKNIGSNAPDPDKY